MRTKKKRQKKVGKDQKKKSFGRRLSPTEKCDCPCHDPKTSNIVFHWAPCCGRCPYCKKKRIRTLCLDEHKEKCRKVIAAIREKEAVK